MAGSKQGWTIRRATPNDAELVVAGINEICIEGGAFYVTRFVPSRQWNAILFAPESVPDHLLIIAEWEGKFAGAARLFPGESHTLFQHVAELGLFVLRPYRRYGLGRSLISWSVNWAKTRGVEKIALSVFATNYPAIMLYRQSGFVEEGIQRRHLKIGDTYVDRVLMALFLS